MMALDERTRKLVAAASRVNASAEAIELALDEEPITYSASGLARVHCVVCGAKDVNVHPRFIRAARCSRCIAEGAPVPDPDPDDRPLTMTYEELKAPYVPKESEPPAKPPEPEWTLHSIGPMPAPPASVTALLKVAEGYGWTGVITYARGQAPKARTVKDNFAVRLHKGGLRAVAVNAGGVWESHWAVAHMLKLPNQGEFKAYLKVVGTDLAESFVKRIRAAAAEAEEKVAPVKCRDGLAHLAHSWKNSKDAVKECPGIACDLLDKHEPHEVTVKIAKKEEKRPCPGRTRKGTAKKEKDNGG